MASGHLNLFRRIATGIVAISQRGFPARGTKPRPRNLWDPYHLEELLKDGYTHEPLRVRRLGGRDPDTGRKVNQHIGGGTKFDYFVVDFHRRGPDEPGKTYDERVLEVRRDPNRTPYLALVAGHKGKRWILATENMTAGQIISTSSYIPENPVVGVEGNAYPLGALSDGTIINTVERYPNVNTNEETDVFVKMAGQAAQVVRRNGDYVIVRLPHKHEFSMHKTCMATVGRLSHGDFYKLIYGSAQMHRRFGYKMSSGLWHKKDGYCGRKVRPLPPVHVLDTPPEPEAPNYKFTISRRQCNALFGNAAVNPLIAGTQFRF
ncbi:Ribosomal Proteins L2, RNA binding domain protein [Aphelenchoides besseyi]|nr:Ribosomal Proteins L2, RNA binding domain protein [Aphelenchoides besseyi]